MARRPWLKRPRWGRRLRKLVKRGAWGAAVARCRTLILAWQVRGICIHYSGGLADRRRDHSECDDVCRAFQAHHMGPGGLGVPGGGCDIAYTVIICPHGFTFQGRGLGQRPGANGTTDSNRRYFAVCIMGGDREGRRDVTDEQRKSLIAFRRRVVRRYPLAGRQVRFHSTFAGTACPGDELRAWARRKWPQATRGA